MSKPLYHTVPSHQWTLIGGTLFVFQDTGENVSIPVIDNDLIELPALESPHLWKVTANLNG